jgi:hypothetical protein
MAAAFTAPCLPAPPQTTLLPPDQPSASRASPKHPPLETLAPPRQGLSGRALPRWPQGVYWAGPLDCLPQRLRGPHPPSDKGSGPPSRQVAAPASLHRQSSLSPLPIALHSDSCIGLRLCASAEEGIGPLTAKSFGPVSGEGSEGRKVRAAALIFDRLTLPRFHVHQTHAAFRLRSKSAGDR